MGDSDGAPSGSRLFTVRIWTERIEGGTEQRGQVRDVSSGAYRSFRSWSDLTDFMADQLEHTTTKGAT